MSRGVPVELRGIRSAYDGAEVLHGIDLGVAAAETISLLGPSGCGKTTLLRCIAGLEHPTAGMITIGDHVVSDGDSTWVAPRHRGLGMVFQDGALFPHLSVAENIAFGIHRNGDIAGRVDEMLDLVGLGGMGDRLPGTLSGGQAQRVALARALAPAPSVLLLDEPFSSLDAALRDQVRGEVQRILREVEVTTVFVTHDQEEAFEMGSLVAVICDGHLEQVAPGRDLYRAPASAWVATFVGEANLVEGTASGTTATTALGEIELRHAAVGAVTVVIRPEDIAVIGPGTHAVQAEVGPVRYRGHDMLVPLRVDGLEITARVQGDVDPRGRVGLELVGPPAAAFPRT
ncbi:MAG TPA: ABC transporter ATP-binding protein [Acidimicrobiales bacterium]|nr:ABC transporter ATP-binding protein [Acidimicrobiales bacterium]